MGGVRTLVVGIGRRLQGVQSGDRAPLGNHPLLLLTPATSCPLHYHSLALSNKSSTNLPPCPRPLPLLPQQMPRPGDPYRWMLPDDPSGLLALMSAHDALHSLVDMQVCVVCGGRGGI